MSRIYTKKHEATQRKVQIEVYKIISIEQA